MVVAHAGNRPGTPPSGAVWPGCLPTRRRCRRPTRRRLAGDAEHCSLAQLPQTSWDVTQPNTAAQVMGAYYPTGTYMSKAQFQKKFGCPGAKNKNKG